MYNMGKSQYKIISPPSI